MSDSSRNTPKENISIRLTTNLLYWLSQAQPRVNTNSRNNTIEFILLQWVLRERRKGGVLYDIDPPKG